MPQATDLVTDLPADFEVFGQAVATSMADLLGGTSGQILAKNSNTDMDFVWIANDQGDITAVTAGTGITGGGTSGAVTVSFDQANFGGGQFAAGKNKVINGDFTLNQRAFTSNTTTASYNFDRWLQQNSGGSFTVTPQSFTAGAAPVAGYEAATFVQGITATQSAAGDFAIITQRIESVRTFAANTVTISFWAKANTGTPKIGVELQQNFGAGGSPSATVSTPAGAVTLTTSFARYSVTVAVPSISGKTIGSTANTSYLELNLWTSSGATNATRASSIGIQNFTASIWGVQVEAGNTATPFQTATGTIQGELAACQRYYYRTSPTVTGYPLSTSGGNLTTAIGQVPIPLPVQMRVAPTTMDFSSLSYLDFATITALITGTFTLQNSTQNYASVRYTHGTPVFTAGQVGTLNTNGTSAYLGFSAEL
jgi:hypothetical protein